ncbi:MAG: thioredoxin family protein [Deltaproteobacteria bacterium]|nr:thioredoxin family protein [Deltaproteobacteria bacterium]
MLDERLAAVLSSSIDGGSFWLALGVAWMTGVLAALTPCVYPLIPITVRYFGGMVDASRRRALGLVLVYIAGMVLLYATLGTVFASLQRAFGTFLASPWVLGGLAVMCVAMGASILGLFTLQLPAAWNARLAEVGGRSVWGALAMGLVSGLIAAPCTGPALVVILGYIATTGDVVLGFTLMTAFALGLGLPFFLLALFARSLQRLPQGGPWMEAVKIVLATAMFVVGLYFAKAAWPVFGRALDQLTWSAVVGGVAVALGVVTAVAFLGAGEGARALKAASIALLTAGVSLLLLASPMATADTSAPHIAWETTHARAVERARAERRPLMIDFTADWCVACKELDHKTYVDAGVRAEAARFVALKIDATEMTPSVEALFAQYSVLGLPTVVFIDSTGKLLPEPRVTGFLSPERFAPLLARVP